jgi:thiol-disulfide isomerase/thioredoxin
MAGCTLFGKKKPDAQQPPPSFPPQTAANTGSGANAKGGPFSTTSNPKAPLPNASGMLAGRVICSYDRQPPPTLIQVVATGEKSGEGKPLEISTNNEGYFTIQGLEAGQGYQLTARTRDGDIKMGGVTFAIAPNPRVLIRISEDFAPAAPAMNKKNDKSAGANDTSRGDSPKRTLGAPTPIGSIADNENRQPPPDAGNSGTKQVAARDQSQQDRIPLNIGASRGPPPTQRDPAYGGNAAVSARVPSCVLNGPQLENFALYDLTGMPWEYRNHRGKLVLLDFWGTWCGPCMRSLPHIKYLSETYSKHGLEVIGIAYEQPAPAIEQVKRVQAVRDSKQLPYRILIGSDIYSCPVKNQFRVESFPYLFLIDENGRIIWKASRLDDAAKQDLELLIRKKLLNK